MKIIERWINSKLVYYSLGFSAIAVGIYGLTFRQISSLWTDPFSWLQRPEMSRIHFITGPIVLISGIFQFNQNLRQKYPSVHVWTGRLYGLANLISVIVVFGMVLHCAYGLIPVISLFILNVLWLISLVIAIYYIVIKKEIVQHKYWMIRNYALTCSAITLRIILGIFSAIFGMEIAYKIATSNCFIWNMILAELVIRKLKQMRNENHSPAHVTQIANSDSANKSSEKNSVEQINIQEKA